MLVHYVMPFQCLWHTLLVLGFNLSNVQLCWWSYCASWSEWYNPDHSFPIRSPWLMTLWRMFMIVWESYFGASGHIICRGHCWPVIRQTPRIDPQPPCSSIVMQPKWKYWNGNTVLYNKQKYKRTPWICNIANIIWMFNTTVIYKLCVTNPVGYSLSKCTRDK